MKINSSDLYDYVNGLKEGENRKFRLWYDDILTDDAVIWNGDRFEWESGRVDSEVFFNPLYDFEIVENKEKDTKAAIKKIYYSDLYTTDIESLCDQVNECFCEVYKKIDEIIDLLEKKS